MFGKLIPLVVVSLWSVIVFPLAHQANASTPLTRAVVKKLHNWVQLRPRNRPKRRARTRDNMTPGDGLATGRASLADLRFNDGSLARIGERAVFKFLPRTRTFRLSNGTVLLLIPPGQGRTRVRTRSAGATIRGSALFVRYDEQTDTTVVGSLTDSGIEVFNKDESRSQVLKAGQLIVVVKGRIQGLYNFDLRTFYNTSDLVRGLDLTRPSNTPSSDPAMASVQAETSEAVAKQVPIVGEKVVENPSFIELSPVSLENRPGEKVAQDNVPVDSLVDTGQVLLNTFRENQDKSPNNSNPTIVETPTPATPATPEAPPTKPAIPATPPSPPTIVETPTPATPAIPEAPPTTGNQNPPTSKPPTPKPPTLEPQTPKPPTPKPPTSKPPTSKPPTPKPPTPEPSTPKPQTPPDNPPIST